MSDNPAAWHADPEHPGQLRYWDGSQWTEHRAPAVPAAVAPTQPAAVPTTPEPAPAQPPSFPPAPPAQPAAPASYVAPTPAGAPSSARNAQKLVLPLLACGALLVVALVVGAVALSGGSSSGKASSKVTKAEFAAKANAICDRYDNMSISGDPLEGSDKELTDLTKAQLIEEAPFIKAGAKQMRQELAELQKLDRPKLHSPSILEAERDMKTIATAMDSMSSSAKKGDKVSTESTFNSMLATATEAVSDFESAGASSCPGG